MNKKMMEHFFTTQFGALIAHPAICCPYLDEERKFLIGFVFPDPAVNYTLLSDEDFLAFPPEMVEHMHACRQSPFRDMLLIFYQDDGGISFKLINGMAGKLLSHAERFCVSD